MKIKRNYLIAGSLAVVIIILAALFFSKRRSNSGELKARNDRRRIVTGFDDPSRELRELALNAQVPYADVLADFKTWSRYPQDSRPLAHEDVDVLNFNKIELPYMAMPIIEDGKPIEPVHSCVLQPDAHTVYENEQLEIHLRCHENNGGKFVFVDVKAVKLSRTAGNALFDVPAPDVRKNEKIPVSIAFTFKPRPQDWGDMELAVDFVIPGEKGSFTHRQKVHFFSSPEAPAKFTGKFHERIENGSLIISTEINARKSGTYRIEANLVTDEGTPVAHARVDTRLSGGSQWVDLLFFGKIFRDSGLPGPYRLAALHGVQQNLPINPDDLSGPPEQVAKMLAQVEQTEPIKRSITPWLGSYRTEPYPLKTFSDAEYDSEFKRERIAELEKLAAAK